MNSDGSYSTECQYWDHSGCEGTVYCPPRCPRFIDKKDVPIIVRQFEPDDFETLMEMYEGLDDSNRTMGLPPIGRSGLKTWLQSLTENGWHVIALDDERVVGHVGVGSTTSPDPEFMVFVRDEYQNRGIGTELIKHTIASAADSGHESIHLNVTKSNERAITVYQNIGFQITGEQAMQIAMHLALESAVAQKVQQPPADRL